MLLTKNLKIEEAASDFCGSAVKISDVYPFDAKKTLTCGQCFRFDETEDREGVFEGVALGKYIRVSSPDENTALLEGVSIGEADDFIRYFDLDFDYGQIVDMTGERFGRESLIYRAAAAGRGIHIMRQESWEALASFIISQNNNIPRIKGIIERLSRSLGEPIGGGKYAFPTASAVSEAGIGALSSARMGFRDKYLCGAAERVTNEPDFLFRVSRADFETADSMLRTIRGVGAKVSACTLLFGFGHKEAFPVDVWIKRSVGKYFGTSNPEEINFGELAPYAGVLQQYIFDFERNGQA